MIVAQAVTRGMNGFAVGAQHLLIFAPQGPGGPSLKIASPGALILGPELAPIITILGTGEA